jgi:hypothetical protein
MRVFLRPRHSAELKERRSAERPLPANGGAGAAPPPKTHEPKPPPRPAGGSHCLGYPLAPGAGWWVAGATGRANGQLRVLGSPQSFRAAPHSTLRGPDTDTGTGTGGTGGPPGGRGVRVRGPDGHLRFAFCESEIGDDSRFFALLGSAPQ